MIQWKKVLLPIENCRFKKEIHLKQFRFLLLIHAYQYDLFLGRNNCIVIYCGNRGYFSGDVMKAGITDLMTLIFLKTI